MTHALAHQAKREAGLAAAAYTVRAIGLLQWHDLMYYSLVWSCRPRE